ncbi:MAG: energy transducer TonB [Desulfobacterales bacterium]|nr:energy transducer TonB [Desulfobacterales bacterium]
MLDIRSNSGLLISGIFHILIMTIPVSMAVVQKFNEVELFVMEEERPVIQKIKAVSHRMPEVVKVTKEEIKREETPQKIEEEPVIIPLPPSVNSNPPIAEVREVVSATQISLPQRQNSQPHDVEFGTAIGPKFLHRELPIYPMIARRLGKEGEVVLRLTLDERGNLLNVEVVKNAGYGFTEAAVEAVKRSTFLPAKKDGRTIVSRAILPIRFMFRRD